MFSGRQSTRVDFVVNERAADVLKLVAQGQTNAEIAKALSIGVTTVRTHVGNLLSKLACTNRTQLALLAVEQNPPSQP